MSKIKNIAKVTKKVLFKTVRYILVTSLVLLVLILGALQLPPVQTLLAQKASSVLSEKTGYNVQIKAVNIRWFDTILLRGLSVKDKNEQTILDVKRLFADFEISSLIGKKNVSIDRITVNNLYLNLVKDKKGKLNLIQFIDAVQKLFQSKQKTKKGKPNTLTFRQISIQESSFNYIEEGKPDYEAEFNASKIKLRNIDALIAKLRVIGNDIEINVAKLSCVDETSKLQLKKLATNFKLTDKSMEFRNTDLRTDKSVVRGLILFKFKDISDMNDFVHRVNITAHLDNSQVYTGDLAKFTPYFKNKIRNVQISTHFQGTVDSFTADALKLTVNETILDGKLTMIGLPDSKNLFINTTLKNSVFRPEDLKPFLPENIYNRIDALGKTKLTCDFKGYIDNFTVKGNFISAAGKADIDGRLSMPKNKPITYEGKVKTDNLSIEKLVPEAAPLQALTVDAEIKGRGTDLKTINLVLFADCPSIKINGYTYNNINADVKIADRKAEGSVHVEDPHLMLDVSGQADFLSDINRFTGEVIIDKADLQAMNLSKESFLIRSHMRADLQGNNIDDIVGQAFISNGYLSYKDHDLNLDTVSFVAEKIDNVRTVNLNSTPIDLSISGDYKVSELIKDIPEFLNEYLISFKNNAKEIARYYAQKSLLKPRSYKADYSIKIKDANALLGMFLPGSFISENTVLEGSFTRGTSTMFNFNTSIDTLIFKEYRFFNSNVDLSASKLTNKPEILSVANITSEEQRISDRQTKNFYIDALWDMQKISFTTKLENDSSTFAVDLKGDVSFEESVTRLDLKPSLVRVFDQRWSFEPGSSLQFTDRRVHIDSLLLTEGVQKILINGTASNNPEDSLIVQIDQFDMHNFTPITQTNIRGLLNGHVKIQDIYNKTRLDGTIGIQELTMDNFLIGDLNGSSQWNSETQRAEVSIVIDRLGKTAMDVGGYLAPKDPNNQIYLDASLNDANLKIIEPFLKEVISDISGDAKGKVFIRGKFNSPTIEGKVYVNNGQFKVNVLNALYSFNDDIIFERNLIGFRNLILKDKDNNTAVVNGGIFHDGFKNFVVDLSGRMRNFRVMDTKENSDEAFYGTAVMTGNFEMLGAFENLSISADAKTEKGTEFFIPVTSAENQENKDYIRFINKKNPQQADSLAQNLTATKKSGIKLDFNVEVTPDAYCEIIFDSQSGDILRGNGSGRLNIRLDTRGDFNMFGEFEIRRGAYNFTLANIISKEFKIRQGSTIRWNGDPMEGVLDIKAAYEQNVSLAPILQSADSSLLSLPEVRRRYPVTVLMDLKNSLAAPDIDFAIEIKDYPLTVSSGTISYPLQGDVLAFQSRVKTDEQELNRQVFSLLILNRLSEYNSFNTTAGGSLAGGSVSQLLSNQLSNWMSQVDENLQIDIDLNGFQGEDLKNIQLRLSYAFLEGRLRVTREGGFTNVQNQTNVSSVVGDWTVEYLLNQTGTLRIKVYNKNNQNSLNSALTGSSSSAGFSLVYSVSFNSLSELFSRKKKRPPAVQLIDKDSREPVFKPLMPADLVQ